MNVLLVLSVALAYEDRAQHEVASVYALNIFAAIMKNIQVGYGVFLRDSVIVCFHFACWQFGNVALTAPFIMLGFLLLDLAT